jgi:hypothetical protein
VGHLVIAANSGEIWQASRIVKVPTSSTTPRQDPIAMVSIHLRYLECRLRTGLSDSLTDVGESQVEVDAGTSAPNCSVRDSSPRGNQTMTVVMSYGCLYAKLLVRLGITLKGN